jgi:hypothetical protein
MKTLILEIYDDAVPEMIAGQRDMNLVLLSRAENLLHDREDSKAILLLKQVISNIEQLRKQIPSLVPSEKQAPVQQVIVLPDDTEDVLKSREEITIFSETPEKKKRKPGGGRKPKVKDIL